MDRPLASLLPDGGSEKDSSRNRPGGHNAQEDLLSGRTVTPSGISLVSYGFERPDATDTSTVEHPATLALSRVQPSPHPRSSASLPIRDPPAHYQDAIDERGRACRRRRMRPVRTEHSVIASFERHFSSYGARTLSEGIWSLLKRSMANFAATQPRSRRGRRSRRNSG
jgi:hypothetical protein